MNRARTLVTVAGVALSAALVTAVVTFGVSMLRYMTNGAIAKYGGWNVEVFGASQAFARQCEDDPLVASVATTQDIGYALLPGAQNPDKPYLFIAGFSDDAFDALPITLLSGRLPENESELLIPTHALANGGAQIAVGDTLTLAVGSRRSGGAQLTQHERYAYGDERLEGTSERTYTVVGICGRLYAEQTRAPGYTAITRASAQAPGSLTAFVTLKNPFTVRAWAQSATDGHGYALNDEVLRFIGLSDDRLFTTLLFSVAAVVIAIVMVGSVFLIYNAFSISLGERMRQFGVLMSVGASARQLRACVLFEGAVIGLLGIPPGILIGLGGIAVAIAAVADRFSGILYASVPLTLCVSAPALLAAAVISLVTILLSAWLPARRAAATPVLACIRQTGELKADARSARVPRWAWRAFGLTGTIALKNFRRNRRRSRSIVLSLTLSIVLFVSANAFVIDLQQASERAVSFTTYDIGITVTGMDDARMAALFDKLKAAEGAYEAAYQASAEYEASVPAGALSAAYWGAETPPAADTPVSLSMSLRFLADDAYRAILDDLGIADPAYMDGSRLLAVAKLERSAGRVLEPDEFDDLFADACVTLHATPAGGGAAQARELAIVPADFVAPDELPILGASRNLPYFLEVFAPYSLKGALHGELPLLVQGFTFRSKAPAETAARLKTLLAGEGVASGYALYNLGALMDESRNMIFIANVFAYAFIVIISLIAAANVFNTISTDVQMRRRELAMLRSVGMGDAALRGMMRFECALYGLRALAAGLPLALLCSLAIYRGLLAGGADNIDFVPPWAGIGVSALSVLLVVFCAMAYASGRVRRENILGALRDELT